MMRFNDWLGILKDGFTVTRTRRVTQKRRVVSPSAPAVEALEDRTLLAALVVTTPDDSVALDGQVSLREAITAANTNAPFMDAGAGDVGLDTISFDPALVGSTITLGGSELNINESLDITGPGADSLTINANNASRIFNIADGTTGVSISDLTLTGGRADNGGAVAVGRGSAVNLNRAIVSNSEATGNGGALWNNGGSLNLIGSTLTGNTAEFGGGIFGRTFGDDGTGITIENSTLDNNTARSSGGGVVSSGGVTSIRNSTFSTNAALAGSGGGLRTEGGTVNLANATFTLNSASTFGGGLDSAGGQVTAKNTLFAQNASGEGGLDVQGTFTSEGGNLIGDSAGSTILGNTTGNILDVDPQLGPLQDNGGITATHALLPGSPAVDAGVDFDLTADQRGTARPQGDFVDIGAFEAEIETPVLITPNGTTSDVTPTFEWTAVPGADRYDLWVNDLTTGQSGIIRNVNVLETSFTPTTPLPDRHAYIWTVAAIFDEPGGTRVSEQAEHKVFTTNALMTPSIVSPIGRTLDSTPTFQWTEIPGAARYDIWVNDRTTGQSGIIRDANVTTNSYTPTTPLPVGHAFIWTVQPITDDGSRGGWAAHRVFVAGNLEAPEILAPIGRINDTTPTFQWSQVTNADHYDLWVNNLSTGQNGVIREKNVSGTTFTPTVPLIDGHKYIWTVRALTDDGFGGEWASHEIFRIDTSSTAPEPEPGKGGALVVPGLMGQTVRVSATILEEEAAYDNEFGFFQVDDIHGRIGKLLPGDKGYAKAALTHPSREVIWGSDQDLDRGDKYTVTTTLPGGSYIGLYLIQDASTKEFLHENPHNDIKDRPLAFFSLVDANPDGFHHLMPLHKFDRGDKYRDDKDRNDKDYNDNGTPNGTESWIFGWEDWKNGGDKDFDDLVFRLNYDTKVDQTTRPELINPLGTIATTTPTFQWTSVPAAARYDLWVNDLTTGHSGVIREVDIQGTTYTPNVPLVDGHKYIWTVHAFDSMGTSGEWAKHKVFFIDTSSASHKEGTLRVPGMVGQTVRVSATILEENAAYDNEFGYFLVDDAKGRIGYLHPGDPGYAKAALTHSSREVIWSTDQDLKRDKTYTVSADLPGGSYVALYLIQNASTKEFLHKNPHNKLKERPLAFFSLVDANPDGIHHLRQWNDDDFNDKRGDKYDKYRDDKDRNNKDGKQGPPSLIFGWEDWKNGGDKDFDDLLFRISYDMSVDETAPEIISPVGTVTTTSPTFQWTPVNAAARYDLWVNDLTSGHIGVIREMNITGTTFTPTVPLTNGHKYIWTVRAFDSAGTPGDWAKHRTFTIDAEPDDTPDGDNNSGGVFVTISHAATAQRETGSRRWDSERNPVDGESHEMFVAGLDHKESAGSRTTMPSAAEASEEVPANAVHAETDVVDAVLADWKSTEWWASEDRSEEPFARNSEHSNSASELAARLAAVVPVAMMVRKRRNRRQEKRS